MTIRGDKATMPEVEQCYWMKRDGSRQEEKATHETRRSTAQALEQLIAAQAAQTKTKQ